MLSSLNFIYYGRSNQNFLFKQYDEDLLVGYAILGVTRNFSFLQRFGIVLGHQNKGHGSELLKNVLNFAKEKKYTNIRLNTQENNKAAKSLYVKHGFEFTKTNFSNPHSILQICSDQMRSRPAASSA